MLLSYAVIFLGGGIGSCLRYGLSHLIATRVGETFPFGTLFVNVTGCLLIGFIAAISASDGRMLLGPQTRQFLMLGVMGGYTTFSSFSLQTLNQMQHGEWWPAGLNIILSVALCLFGCWLGWLLANLINNWR